MMLRNLLWILFLATCIREASAQITDPRFTGRPEVIEEPSDSLVFRPALVHTYLLRGDLNEATAFSDTGLTHTFIEFDPVQIRDDLHINLGYPGSSAEPLFRPIPVRHGFYTGFTQYNLYKINFDEIKIYTSNRTVADLSFFQRSGDQNNFNANADYFQQFDNDLSLSLNYTRHKFNGIYRGQSNKNTGLGMVLAWLPQHKNARALFTFLNNAHEESHNGGIPDATQATEPFSIFRVNVPVSLAVAEGRHAEKTYNFLYEKDLGASALTGGLEGEYQKAVYRYSDAGMLTALDSAVYQSLVTDPRGQRFALETNRFSAAAHLSAVLWSKYKVKAALMNEYYIIRRESTSIKRNDLTASLKMNIGLRRINLDVDGHFGLGANAGNFLIRGATEVKVGREGIIDLSWSNFLQEVGETDKTLEINGLTVYHNDFKKMIGTQAHAAIRYRGLGLSFDQYLVKNLIYYNSSALPQQHDAAYSQTAVKGTLDIYFGVFGMENAAVFQLFSNNLFQKPSYYTHHDVHVNLRWFKERLQLRLGSICRIIPEYTGQSFQPLTGRFYQGDAVLPLSPEWSVYLSAKVSSLRILVAYDNLAGLFKNKVNYNTQAYPNMDPFLRFGARWILLD